MRWVGLTVRKVPGLAIIWSVASAAEIVMCPEWESGLLGLESLEPRAKYFIAE